MYQRLYDFMAGTRISSDQVDEEFNNLIKAVNTLEASDKLKAPISEAQMYKITRDNGGIKHVLDGPNNNLTAMVEGNLATFYSTKDTVNNPDKENSFRGIYVSDTPGFGELLALGANQTIWRNSKVNGAWLGWVKMIDDRDFKQTELWKGAHFVNAEQTITPTKPLSACRNGWVLVWSDFDPGDKPSSNDFNWAVSYVPKFFAAIDNGGGLYVPMIYNMTSTTVSLTGKYLYINNATITGHSDNAGDTNNANDVCLRYVYDF